MFKQIQRIGIKLNVKQIHDAMIASCDVFGYHFANFHFELEDSVKFVTLVVKERDGNNFRSSLSCPRVFFARSGLICVNLPVIQGLILILNVLIARHFT